ncbi:MAG: TRAP transporter fused permease subunit [Gammaproteobacteria bacterium]|nr:TRAP transporter permease [Gammaproteobacteria bacterium]NIP88820.1 TRAP transporter permease [Gammaproteobacteria bacterium]NIR24726.1 TRAP transporter permease [Gammaproteobacteria bacterium]NIS05232.1 TRAP transporter permease [Gammaproteobacteria bacterium]NIU42399.1 TRAP transporter fused permease subunit [Gammaproteobacteria bacterium]
MAEDKSGDSPAVDQSKLQDMIAESDTGARAPTGIPARVLWVVPLAWAIFQLWYASPMPYVIGAGVLNSTEVRSIHLAFAIFLAYLAYPALKSSPRKYIPILDWVLASVAAFCAAYIFLFYRELSERPGLPTTEDLIVSVIGIVLILEATRRALGPPLAIVCVVFITYTFGGHLMPEMIAHQGASLAKGMSHYYLTTEGVFGIALGVSASMVFLFVLFGSLLERAGAGNYFIRVAFALMGHLRGGPAKAAVVSSGMTGLVSGSAIANVVTTGTFTIPLMRKVGFSAEKAGAVEVASSTNGQLTPPIMGAVAFLMVEYVGISYLDVIKHAALPALISYIALVYIVHLEACKADMKGLAKRRSTATAAQKLMSFLATFLGLVVLTAIVYYGLGWMKGAFGAATPWIAAVLIIAAYVGLVKYAIGFPELETSLEIKELPETGPTVKAGLYYLLPVIVLVWCLTVERLSPGLSALYASVFMLFVLLTQKALKAFLRRTGEDAGALLREGLSDMFDGMIAGSRNMIGIGVATAAAGLVVGTITLTGVGLVMAEFVEFISGGYVLPMLIFTAILSLILGMGLPTTANYIVVSSLMAPVIVTVGAQSGLIVPLVAVHMFVFYFGILADDTPPVAMAAFAAAAISGGDPIRTGIQGFAYDIRTAILPFMFIFNTELLLIGVRTWYLLLSTIVTALLAMLLFAAGTQGYFLIRSRLWESLALILIAFTLFRPGFWMDMIYPPLESVPATAIYEIAESLPEDAQIRIRVVGEDLEGRSIDKIVMLPLGAKGDGKERLANAGLELRFEDGKALVDNVVFGSTAERQKIDFDYEIPSVERKADRPPRQLFYIPALLLLGIIVMAQLGRRKRLQAASA